MKICACGNVAEENSALCARCSALQTLELKGGASSQEIESAFEVLSKAWNPERFPDDDKMKATAEENLKAIAGAHTLLTRPSLQAAPYRSEAEGARVEAPIDAGPVATAPRQTQRTRKLGHSDTSVKPLRLPLPLAIGCGVVLVGFLTAWFLFKPLDAMLMATPVAGSIYADFKTNIQSSIQDFKDKVLKEGTSAPGASEAASGPAPGQPPQDAAAGSPVGRQPAAQRRGAGRTAKDRVFPYITAGLSQSEVIAVEGAPTIATSEKLVYGKSEFYFRNDSLTGWKIDPASGIRVKLWPDAVVDPGLSSFHVGSSKNEVIVVEGTPAFFSENKFGYGASEVYFQNNRVVSWKNDPSAPLRISTR